MAFIQYLVFDGEKLPLPDSYDLDLSDVEADSSGETEAGTTQRDVVRTGVVTISVSFSVSPSLSLAQTVARRNSPLTPRKTKSPCRISIRKLWSFPKPRCISRVTRRSSKRIRATRGFGA